jgi:hypothetical protein
MFKKASLPFDPQLFGAPTFPQRITSERVVLDGTFMITCR